MPICQAYPDYLKIELEKEGEFKLIDKVSGKQLTIWVQSKQGDHIERDSYKCKEVNGEVFHHIKRKGAMVWVVEGQTVD
jgi:hypothetical protein